MVSDPSRSVARRGGTPLERVLDALRAHGCDPHRNGDGWTAKCPAHDDRVASLTASEGADEKAIVRCHAGDGCPFPAIARALDLPESAFFPSKTTKKRSTIVATYDYVDESGALLFQVVRYTPKTFKQRAPDGNDGWAWSLKGILRVPYRLPAVIETAGAGGTIYIVEGEKDADAAVAAGVCATTAPQGAGKWKDSYSEYLRGAGRVVVVADRDPEGYKHIRQVAASVGAHVNDVIIVEPIAGKDLSDHLRAGHGIDELVPVDRGGSVLALPEPAPADGDDPRATSATAQPPMPGLASSQRILDVFTVALPVAGVVGEDATAQLVFLALQSAALPEPVSLALKGPSSSGKTYVVQEVVKFYPAEAYLEMTAMSEKALIFLDDDFQHRTIVLYEAEALRENAAKDGNQTAYLVRSLLSEHRIRYPITEKAGGRHAARWIEKEGPTGLIVTTTATELHPENETRMFSVTTDDSQEQTRRILRARAEKTKAAPDYTEWHALQQWLQANARPVVVPYAVALAELIPPVAVRLRRDFMHLLSLVEAHALLHQNTRGREGDAVVADLDDYAVVRGLVGDIISEGVGQAVNATVRETVAAVADLADPEGIGVTAKAIGRKLGIDKSAAGRRLARAAGGEYVRNLEDRRGHPGRWVLGEDLPAPEDVLPSVEVVAHRLETVQPPMQPPEPLRNQGEPGSGCTVDALAGGSPPEDPGEPVIDEPEMFDPPPDARKFRR